MGFTGKRALQWKMTYIAAFNALEAELRKPVAPQPALTREQCIAAAVADRHIAALETKASRQHRTRWPSLARFGVPRAIALDRRRRQIEVGRRLGDAGAVRRPPRDHFRPVPRHRPAEAQFASVRLPARGQ